MITGFWSIISAVVAVAIALVIVTFALIVAWKLLIGKIDLTYLLTEPSEAGMPEGPPKASISRFQFLIFTFVIAGVYLVLCLEGGRFVEIPQNVILLLGVSGTSYAASKGIRAAAESRRTPIVETVVAAAPVVRTARRTRPPAQPEVS